MAKFRQKLQARKFRKAGKSIKNIANILDVSSSTVSLWCRDIELTKEQIKKLEQQSRDPFYGRRMEYILSVKKKVAEKTQMLYKQGIQEVGVLNKRELFLSGIALYWSEGFKKDSQVGFANSNPKMIKLFIKWLEECCGYTKNDLLFRVTVNISHKKRLDEIERYWATVVDVPGTKFQKAFYQNVKWKKIYENPNEYFGVLRIRVRRSKDFLRKIHGWIEGLSLQA